MEKVGCIKPLRFRTVGPTKRLDQTTEKLLLSCFITNLIEVEIPTRLGPYVFKFEIVVVVRSMCSGGVIALNLFVAEVFSSSDPFSL